MTSTPTSQDETRAPDFSLLDNNRNPVSLADFRGQPVVLAFWPPGWNPERGAQIEYFNQLVCELNPHDARLLGLEMEGDWCELDFDDAPALRFPLLQDFDPQGATARAYGVYGQNALFVLDGEGTVRWSQIFPVGVPPKKDDVLAALRALNASSDEARRDQSQEPSTPAFALSRRNFLTTIFAASLALSAAPLMSRAQDFAARDGSTPVNSESSGKPAAPSTTASPVVPVTLKVNGATHRLNLEPRVSLLDALRENIGLTGSKKGCNAGACGACTVLVNGERINSCLTLAVMHQGDEITTVEGLAKGEVLHPVQAAFIEHDGFQCGYCTSGQVVSGVACIREGHAKSEGEIREWMSGNICRCGAYPNIVRAIQAAAGAAPSTHVANNLMPSGDKA